MRRKKEKSKRGQTNQARQHSTPKATFPKKNELPRVGLDMHFHTEMFVKKAHDIPLAGNFGVTNVFVSQKK